MLINDKQFLVIFHKEPDWCRKCYFEDKDMGCPQSSDGTVLCIALGENVIFMEDSRAKVD